MMIRAILSVMRWVGKRFSLPNRITVTEPNRTDVDDVSDWVMGRSSEKTTDSNHSEVACSRLTDSTFMVWLSD
jgi:hypothetical protein